MDTFLLTLRERNTLLYWFGMLCLIGFVGCITLSLTTSRQVLGVNAFVKPAKFFIAIWIFCWTMGWYTGLLTQKPQVNLYSWILVIAMVIELVIITGQAAQGKLSHFNVSSTLDSLLFTTMGVAITIATLWTAYIGLLFFGPHHTVTDAAYLWGIRLGILFFVIFAFEGGLMGARLSHTVGAADGSLGLPGLNWSKQYGDLRIAHFWGMHALQILPLLGYYVTHRTSVLISLSAVYFLLATLLFVQALRGKPLIAYL
ncbi:hypothetical protein BWI93_08680 [Siphonobacter sp. BAB-5385]|uniref:hypothetical protein n=1 Tax=unclassified Siphonobacter TaxID=2635712 RepID=UPI000B9E2FD3|nr:MULTISPECIES: hypothetical protein [unclassified Siphonobacter]OZI08466.1 hypothetical protein BWI93_08680 [Siphonobacter sp. BAB-5385]PMD99146.1 hypothetical protein BWI97_01700 [Siphonobacter sp. BAB-5405]